MSGMDERSRASQKDHGIGTRLVLLDENGDIVEEVIEDEPDQLDLAKFFKTYFKSWKLLILAMIICGALMGYLRPGTTSTVEGASVTLYIPPYLNKEVDGREVRVPNSTSQISNALGLIQSKVYRDQIAEHLGAESLSKFGSYDVSRQKDTEIITIRTYGSDQQKSMVLCEAVKEVLMDRVGPEVSINGMLEVDPVTPFTNVSATSTRNSVIRGALIGAALYSIYAAALYFKDRTLSSKKEAEQYLGIPVMAVFPVIEDKEGESAGGTRSGSSAGLRFSKTSKTKMNGTDQNDCQEETAHE